MNTSNNDGSETTADCEPAPSNAYGGSVPSAAWWQQVYWQLVDGAEPEYIGYELAEALEVVGRESSGCYPFQVAAHQGCTAAADGIAEGAEQLWAAMPWLLACNAANLTKPEQLETWILLLLTVERFVADSVTVPDFDHRELSWFEPLSRGENDDGRSDLPISVLQEGLFDTQFNQLAKASLISGDLPISALADAARERAQLYTRPEQVVRLLLLLWWCERHRNLS